MSSWHGEVIPMQPSASWVAANMSYCQNKLWGLQHCSFASSVKSRLYLQKEMVNRQEP